MEHPKEDQKVNTVTNLDKRIEEVLDIVTKPLNFEKYFPWTQSLVIRNFCYVKRETDSVGN